MTTDPSQLLAVDQAAKALPLSEPALRAEIGRQEFEVVRIGGRVFLREEAVVAALGPDLYKLRSA